MRSALCKSDGGPLFPRASKTLRLTPPSRNVSASLLFVLPLAPLCQRLPRSLLCIIKTLEQIFILFAIQLDRQFPGRLRKYLLFCGAEPRLKLHHPWPLSSLSRNYLARRHVPLGGWRAPGHVLVTIYLTHRCCFIILNFNLCFMQ